MTSPVSSSIGPYSPRGALPHPRTASRRRPSEGDLIPIYIISLPGAAARRERMAAQFARLALPYRFFDAIDGRGLSREALEAAAPAHRRRYWNPLVPGEIGCALSHLAVIRTVAAAPDPYAVVLEDDVSLGEEFPRLLAALEAGPPAFDMMWLAHVPRKKHRAVMPLGRFADRELRARVYLDYTLAAVVYRREAAARIAAAVTVIDAPIDHMLWRNHTVPALRAVEVHPQIVVQDMDAPSTIRGRKFRALGARARLTRERIRWSNLLRRWRSFAAAWGPTALLRVRRASWLK